VFGIRSSIVRQPRIYTQNRPQADVSDFNPYREWLGIQTSGSITCYQLLGVKRQDSPKQVHARATHLIQQLRQVDATGREDHRDKLVESIKRAANILMDAERRELYDQKLAAKKTEKRKLADQEKETQAPHPAPAKPAKAKATKQKTKTRKTVEKQQEQTNLQPVRHDGEKNVTDELMRLRPRRQNIAPAYKTEHRRSKAFSFSMLLGALSLAGIGYLVFTQTPWAQELVAMSSPASDQPRENGGDSLANVSHSGSGTQVTSKQPVGTIDTSGFAKEPHLDKSDAETQDQLAMGKMPAGDDLPEGEIGFQTNPTANPHRGKAMVLFKQARHLLGQRKIELAKGKLEKARPFSGDPTSQLMLGRLETLTNYVEAYWQAADDQLDSYKAGSEAQIGGQRVMVVESTSEKIVLRIAGKNRTINRREEQPLRLAMKLADTWFDQDAASTKVFRGAMMAVTPDFEPDDARALWNEAEASGEINLGDLAQVLDDRYE